MQALASWRVDRLLGKLFNSIMAIFTPPPTISWRYPEQPAPPRQHGAWSTKDPLRQHAPIPLQDARLLAAENEYKLQRLIGKQLDIWLTQPGPVPPKTLDEMSRAIDIKLDKRV